MIKTPTQSFHPPWHQIATIAALAVSVAIARAAIPTTYPTGSGITVGFSNGQVTYGYDSRGDRIPDFSKSGYKGGDAAIPTPPVTTTLNPVSSGDDGARIQTAINNIASLPIGANGFRGVLKLNAGVYRISAPVYVRSSGIVIRGAGSSTSGTIIRRTANNGDAIIVENIGGLQTEVSGTRKNITTSYVPVGATWFAVENTSGLAVGDSIMIQRAATDAWKNNLPDPDAGRPAGNYGVKWDRTITEIDGNRIRVDAPIMQAIESQWGGGYIYKYTWPQRIENCGIEDLRCDSPGNNVDSRGETDGNTCKFYRVKNCWVRRVWNDHMRGHVVQIDGSKWVTAQDITSYHNALGSHSGASIQIFTGSYSDSIAYHHITARAGGFEFTAGRQHGGPVIFSESLVPTGFAASGPHMQGNAGMLWDNCRLDHGISVEYQGKGWGGFNNLIYNCEITNPSRGYNLERPNTVHLWLWGSKGGWSQGSMSAQPIEVQSHGTFKTPQYLFRSQLTDRVGSALAGQILGTATIGSTDPGTGGGGGATTYEAESLVITANSGDSYTTNSESGASNGKYVQYNSNATGDYVQYRIPNVSPGAYTVTIGYKRQTSRGIVQTQVGPEGGSIGNLGSTIDMYGSSAFTSVSIGTWTIGTTGNKTVRFNVTGKNPSSSSYIAAIDYITLTPQ